MPLLCVASMNAECGSFTVHSPLGPLVSWFEIVRLDKDR